MTDIYNTWWLVGAGSCIFTYVPLKQEQKILAPDSQVFQLKKMCTDSDYWSHTKTW